MDFDLAYKIINSDRAFEELWKPCSRIIGFGIGKKLRRTDTTQPQITDKGPYCVTAFVVHKVPITTLRVVNQPDAYSIVDGIATSFGHGITFDDVDVVEVGDEFRFQIYTGSGHSSPATVNTQKWFDAIRPGIGVCNPSGNYPGSLDAGTASFFVNCNGKQYLISCNHVIAGTVATMLPSTQTVIQPASRDLNGNDITRLGTSALVEAEFGVAILTHVAPLVIHVVGALVQHKNTSDIAAAELLDSRRHSSLAQLPFGGRIRGPATDYRFDPATNVVTGTPPVYKVGRTSAYTEGTVMTVCTNAVVSYPAGKVTIVNSLSIEPATDNTGHFSSPGDSGSPLLTEDHELVGVVFSGGPYRALATQISVVLTDLAHAMGAAVTVVT